MRRKCPCFPNKVLVYSCSGPSQFGEVGDRVARRLSRTAGIRMGCIAGVIADQTECRNALANAGCILSLDGCELACASRALSAAGHKGVIALSIKDLTRRFESSTADGRTVRRITATIISFLKKSGKFPSARTDELP